MAQDAVDPAAAPAESLLGLTQEKLLAHLMASAALLALLLLVRFAVRRALARADWKDDAARARTQQQVGNATVLALALGLLVLWAPELRTFALSAVALAAACVLATKELIMCLSGAVLRASSGAYGLGDRIEIDRLRGDVIRVGMLSTTILEVDPSHQRTGRTLVLPNSLLLTKAVANETHTGGYLLHSFAVPIAREEDWHAAETRLLELAREVCGPWLEPVRTALERLARENALPVPQTEPRVSLSLPEPGRVTLLVRVPVPVRQKARVEQEILRRFLGGPPAAEA